jgi:NAD(P)-dependent dehydrogenase (short-subunit alcohol dehydrogenase family)
MQACRAELERNTGSFVISASVAGLKPSGSSMVRRIYPPFSSLGLADHVGLWYVGHRLRTVARRPPPKFQELTASAVSKAATIHLAKSLAIACAPAVRVNAVAAGVMLTDWSKGFTKLQIKHTERTNALSKITDVEDVALVYGERLPTVLSRAEIVLPRMKRELTPFIIPVSLLENTSMTVSWHCSMKRYSAWLKRPVRDNASKSARVSSCRYCMMWG